MIGSNFKSIGGKCIGIDEPNSMRSCEAQSCIVSNDYSQNVRYIHCVGKQLVKIFNFTSK